MEKFFKMIMGYWWVGVVSVAIGYLLAAFIIVHFVTKLW